LQTTFLEAAGALGLVLEPENKTPLQNVTKIAQILETHCTWIVYIVAMAQMLHFLRTFKTIKRRILIQFIPYNYECVH
jgi:hypothetical protein